ncbi:MAG: DUF2023 family protein [Deltaproteobacteria bacterium]|nr:DUF2023 family protein [Deltaproteobacteria bacterium]
MRVFQHHLYEYRKGLRSLVLHTLAAAHRSRVEERLDREGIPYLIYPLGKNRINLFFGAGPCVDVIGRIGKTSLLDYTPEEDFILGTMLGYSRLEQCERYLRRSKKGELKRFLPCGAERQFLPAGDNWRKFGDAQGM